MLFCSTMFGQGPEWQAPTQGTYEDYMSFTAMIQIDGANPNRSDLKIAAFNNGIVRGVGTSQIWNSDVTIVMFKIYGDKNDVLNFKLYVPGDNPEDDRILDTDFTIKLDPDYTGTSNVLNFYKKHFVVDNEYDLSMTVGATVRIDGVDPKRTDLELAAFCGDEVRGVAKAIYWQSQDMYYYELIVGGRIDGEEITYKLYDPIADVDLLTDYKTTFKDGSTIDDGYGKPVTIEFKNNPVAMITNATGNHYFSSLEAAVAAAVDGETIVLLQDVNLTETLTIEKSITIDLNEKNVTLSTGGNMIESDVIIKNGNLAIADVDTQTTGNRNCFISTNVGASLTFDDINMTGNGYTTHWAVLCAMSSSTAGSTINITNSTVTLSNEKGSAGGFIKDQSGVDNYSQINISNSTLTLTNVSRGFTGAKVTLNDVDLTITGGEHGINGSELVIENGSNVSISNGTGRAITLNKFDASITGSNVTISDMGEGGIRYKTANTLTVDASSTLSETTAHADVDNAKLNDKVVRGTESQMSTVKVENGVTTVINPVSGQVAYRAYIEDSENREAVKVDLQNVNALNSLAVKLYDANGNLLTTTTYRAGAVEAPEYLTCNIVLWGNASSSWETVISAEKLTVDNYPHKAELVVDGSVINTFENILGNATDAAAYQLPAYKALGCVYKAASITKESKTEYYGTLAAAVNAAQDGDEIVLLDNVTDVDATISKKITLNLNEKIINDAYIIVKSEVNIKNGSIKNVNESYPLVVQDGGKLTVEDVDIEASKSDRAIWVRSGSSLVFNSGSILATKGEGNNKTNLIAAIYTDTNTDVTINGGTITVDTPDNKAIGIFGNYTNANVTLNDGKISTSGAGYNYGINVDGDITVNGGEIVTNKKGYGYSSGIRYGNNYALVSATGDVTITGGNITTNGFSGYIVNVGRTYSSNDQTVSITGGTFVNNLSEVEMTQGGHKAPVLVWTGTASTVTATVEDGNFQGFSANLLRKDNDDEKTTLQVSGGTFDGEINEEYIAPGYKLEEIAYGTYGVVVDPAYGKVAKIGDTYYETLAEAIAAVGAGNVVIELVNDATLDYNAREAYGTAETTSLTINGNGKTLTLNQKDSDWSSFGLANAAAKVVFNNMTIEKTGYGDTSGAWNTHTIIFSSNVEMNDVTVNNSMAVQNGATLNNVTINEANGYYGLWINGNGQSVTMNGGSINATNGGRGIKIADQYVGAPALVTLSVTGTTFNTAEKAAVLVSSKAGAVIAASNVNIENVAEDKVNFAWVDEDWAAHYGEVTVTGGTLSQESVEIFNVTITDNNNAIQGYYKNIATAIADAQAGETVNLLDNYSETLSEVLLIDKSLTINGNGKTLTSSATRVIRLTASEIEVTINNLNMVSTAVRVGTNDVRGISIDIIDNVTLTLNNCSVDFIDASANDWAYAVNVTGGNDHKVTVNGGSYEGANVINVRGASNIIVVNDATLNCTYPNNDMYYGACIWVLQNQSSSVEATGNTFNGGNAVAFNLGTGTDLTESNNTDNTTKVIAKIGNELYVSLQEAIDAATEDATIVVLHNIELTQGVTVPADKTFTLDLNGKVVSGVSNTAATSAVITNNGNLTVKTSVEGGKITSKANNPDQNSIPAYANNTITNCGVLTLVSGTIENSTVQGLACFPIDNNSTVRDAVLNINGGTVTGRGAIRQFANSNTNKNEVNVTAGTVTGTSYAIWVQNPGSGDPKASLNIAGGELSKILMDPNANFEGSIRGGTITEVAIWEPDATNPGRNPSGFITGGTFGMDVTEFCAFNYVCTSNGDGTYGIEYKQQENNAFVIETLHELEAFRDAVNAGNTFKDQTVVLSAGVDLNPTRAINYWEPIGTQANPFKGTFDGGDNTISNLVVEGENNVGLFGYATSATIKNVKINNANVKGTDCVGAIAGQVYSTSLIDNCHVSGLIQVEGQTNVGGIVGKYYTKVKNCSVIGDGVATSYVKGTYVASDLEGDNIAGIMGHGGENNRFENNTVKNITISGTRKVAGIVGVTDMNTQVKNCVVENVNIETTATAEYANSKKNTMSNGTLVGSYTTGNNTTGTVESCVVKNVNFLNPNNAVVSVGPITGGLRGGTDGMLAPTGVTASGNNIYMSTITGSNNLFLMNPVAKIGTTEYYTLFDAVAAVQDGETTITMLRNTAEEFAIDNTTANITLDMAGNTLTGAITPSKANLTIKGGTINNENASYSAIEINEGSLNLSNVNIESKRHAVRIDGAVEAIINGGTYKPTATSGTRHAVNVSGAANVTIQAGTFVGPKGTTMDSGSAVNVQTGATVTINGGDFSGGKNHTLSAAGTGTLIVKGGTFDQDPSAYLADAYTVNIENEMYVVRYTPIKVTYPVGNPVYPEGKVEYYSDMLEAVPYTTNCPRLEGATITLLADVSGAGMRFMENDMVFDLNGHTYTITAGTGSQGTNTSGFQIRPEVTTNVLFKNGTIKVAEGAPVVWMFNCYATDFIVENVTVDCSNMAYSYGDKVYVVVSREGDNVQLTGETKIVNFNSNVAGNAINVGDTMTIGEYVELGGGTIELDGGAQLTAPAGLNVVTVDGYMVVYENGVYKSVKVVAQVGENKFGSVIAALNYAIANNEAQVKIVSDSRELMPTDVYLRLNADLEITAEQPYTVKFYNNGTSYDFVVDSDNSNTLTFGENVTFQLEDRIIWLGYDGNDVRVVVNGTLAASQIWHGADTKVTSTGTIKSTGEAFVMRRGATLTVDGGTVNANYFNILAGNIDAENANITCGAMWIANTGNYIYEGNVNINIKSSTLTSNGNLKSSTAHADGVSINFENSEVTFVLFDGGFVSDIDANTKLNVKGTNAAVSIKGLTNNGLVNVTETAKLTLTGTVTNNGAMKLDATSVIYAPENLGVTIDDNDYDVVYENGAYRAVHKPFVAEVDGTQFTSLQAAIDAADGKTVVVLDNITLTETVTVAAGTTVTLDLNGKTVSAEATFAVKAIVNNGTLTINGNGGTIDISASTTESIQVVDNYGTLTINGGTYKGATSNYSYAIRANDANSVTNIVDATITTHFGAIGINKGVTTITDGKFEVTSQAGGHALYVANAEVTINGGEFIPYANGYSYAVLTNDANAKVSITGGTFKKGLGDPCVKALSGNFIITGGTFSTDVDDEYCHEYYDAIQGDDNLWRVEQVLFAQTREFISGWNWFSSYINLSKDNGLSKLQNAIVQNYENGVGNALIKGQTNNQSVQYDYIGTLEGVDYYDWTGNTFAPVANKMYMIYTSEAIASEDFMIEGEKVDYENTTIALFQGWNWISYPLDEPTLINEALKNFTGATTGDQIKWYGTGFVTYANGKWYPENFKMMPGEGYMYKAAKQGSFMYSKGTGNNRSDANANMTVENSHWSPEISQYANNMTITAMLSVDDEIVKGDYEIAAFANGECRGSARPIYVEELDAYVLLMAVFGEDVEELTFKYYDVNYETEYELSNRINYSNDAVVGSIDEPYMFNLDILNIGETSVENISIYPNPTTTGSEINLQAVCDKVEVFNALGVKVAEYTNVDSIDAIETAGVYVIRLTIDNSARNCRLIVK